MIIDALQIPTPERRWLEAWRAGGVSSVHITLAIWEDARQTVSYIGKWRRVLQENNDIVELACTADDIERIAGSGRTAVIFGFQNTAPIEHDIELIGAFHALGVRIMQLTYNLQNYIGSGYWEERDSGISSRFGRTAIAEMNRVGILIDLSHCGDRTTLEAIELSERPVSITHANPREYVGKPAFGAGRLKASEAVRLLASRGGVIGLSPNRHMTKRGVETTLEEFCDMVAWTVDLIGIDAVAFGTDYCPGHPPTIRNWWRYARWSRETAPAEHMKAAPHEGWQDWFSSPADFQNILRGFEAHGFARDEIEKITGSNWLRLFRESFGPPKADG